MKFLVKESNKSKPGIYIIKNNQNGRFYIGSTKNLFTRYKSHFYLLKKNEHGNRFLQNDWNKHKDSAEYEFNVVELINNPDTRLIIEQKWLDNMFQKSGCMNIKSKVNSKPREKHSNNPEETKRKISAIRKENWKDPNYREKQVKRLAKYSFRPKTCKFISPKGEVITITNYAKFCKKHPEYKKQGFVQLGLERTKSYKGWTKYNPQSKKIRNTNAFGAKKWCFLSPEGKKVTFVNLLKFCRENNLHCSSMHMVYSGKRKIHKGWMKANDK